jgi:hypothetical protein
LPGRRPTGAPARVYPATLTGALIYAGFFVLLGLAGTFVIRGLGRRALRNDAMDRVGCRPHCGAPWSGVVHKPPERRREMTLYCRTSDAFENQAAGSDWR